MTRADGVDPVGTAGAYDGYLLIEWPSPWPRDLGDIPELAPLTRALVGTGIRLQGLLPRSTDAPTRRVALYRRPDGHGFAGFDRIERLVPAAEALSTAVALLSTPVGPAEAPVSTQDVLICTHGQRDVCCGALGTALAMDLDHVDLSGGARVTRTSHTGGHRFAPTAIVLPQATVWAFLDAAAVGRIVTRTGPLDDLLPRYRGCAGLQSAPVQALEREAFADVGWPWLDLRRRGHDLGDGRVRLEAVGATGAAMAWEAVVEAGRMVPVPECGRAVDAARKVEPEWIVRDVRRE